MIEMEPTVFPRRDDTRRGGFTLIEVVIALAIFLFGALAIVRIFPPALGIIQNSGDQLTAINLNRSTLAKFDQAPGLVPDATYDASGTFPGAVVGTSLRNLSLPRENIQDFDSSALNHFKSVVGERHIVEDKSPTAPPNPFILTRFAFDNANLARTPLIYEEDSVDNVLLTPTGTLDFSEATLRSDTTGSNFKDTAGNYPPATYRNSGSAVPALGDTLYYVSYSWIEDGEVHSLVDEPISYNSTIVTLPTVVQENRSTATPVTGMVQLRLRRLKHKFTVIPPTDVARSGSIALPTANFKEGDTVSVDYLVADWRWLINDELPSVKPEGVAPAPPEDYRQLSSPVRFLDKNLPIYALLVSPTGGLSTSSFQNGSSVGAGFPPPPGDPLTTPVNYKTGQIILDLRAPSALQSRVAYRTLDNWTHQLSVAARSYKPVYVTLGGSLTSNPAEPWRDYTQDMTLRTDLTGRRQFLYFRPSEAGKSVSISYIYVDSATSVRHEVKNRVFQISQRTVPSNSVSSVVNTGGIVAELELTDNNGDRLDTNEVVSVQSVRGASIQARTAWLDGSRFTQVSSVGFREVNN